MVKYILRRPLLPILILLVMIFEVCFMGSLRKGIERDIQLIEETYNNTTVTFSVLPGMKSGGTLVFRVHSADRIELLDCFDEAYYYLECPYTLRKPESVLGCGWLLGTNNAAWVIKDWGLEAAYADDFDPAKPWFGDEDEIPCIIDREMMEARNFKLGDRFVIAPYDGQDFDYEKAPDGNMKIVGYFDNTTGSVLRNGLIIPSNVFMEKPYFMYYWRIQEDHWAYRKYEFTIKSEYNKRFDEVEEQILEVLERADVILHSDFRMLRKAVRPIEERLQILKTLENPLDIAFAIVTAVMALLFAISLQNEIFLRRIWGESMLKTFLILLLSMGVIILMGALITGGIAIIVLGSEWIKWVVTYLAKILALSMVMAAMPTAVYCNKNLVSFYQSRE